MLREETQQPQQQQQQQLIFPKLRITEVNRKHQLPPDNDVFGLLFSDIIGKMDRSHLIPDVTRFQTLINKRQTRFKEPMQLWVGSVVC